jgi:preprotein translocase subunit SecD
MKKFIVSTIFSLVLLSVDAQQAQLDSVKWVQRSDVSKNKLKNGYYLLMELPVEHKDLGFIDGKTKKSYLIGKDEHFTFSKIVSAKSYYDSNFKTNVTEITFDKSDSIRLFQFSNRWKGFKIGLIVNLKLVQVSTLDISPISKGKVAIAGFKDSNEAEAFIKAIKSASYSN